MKFVGVLIAAAIVLAACSDGSGGGATPRQPTATDAPTQDYTSNVTEGAAAYAAAIRSGDGDWLFSHLHRTALSFYGVDTCRTWFDAIGADPTFALEIDSVSGPGPWTWAIYGDTIATIPDVYTASVSITQGGQTQDADIHLHWNAEAGALRVFSPCIPPLAG